MSTLAVVLVLSSSFCHAGWNLLAKRAGRSGTFVWLFSLLSIFLYLPVALILYFVQSWHIDLWQCIFIAGSAVIHIGYFLTLQKGYQIGDLSLVYPLARGTGPLLSTLAAIAILGERPSALALFGAALIIGGVFILLGDPRKLLKISVQERTSVYYALMTGLFIATYTLWDKYAVSTLLVAPVLFDWSSGVIRTALMSPIAIRQWDKVKLEWRMYRLEAFGIALLSPLAYILVLIALTTSPVSHVAPMREMSILIGTLLGTRLLSEGNGRQRLIAAGIILLGIILLALN